MDELVLQMVKLLIQQRQDAKVSPAVATMVEMNKQIKESLNRLYKAGKVHVGDTINDKYITLK